MRNELQLNQEKRLILEAGATYPLIFSVESDQTISIYFTLSSTCRLVLIGRREGIPKLSDHHFLDTIGKGAVLLSIYLTKLFSRTLYHRKRPRSDKNNEAFELGPVVRLPLE